MENLKLWNSVCVTDPQYTNDVQIGSHKYTAVDAYYRFKKATEVFGSFGQGWWIGTEKFDYESVKGLCIYTADLCYKADAKQGIIPIHSAIPTHEKKKVYKNRVETGEYEIIPDDDFIKKVVTDALTKGLSMLGFSADVFLGKFEDSKYVAAVKQEMAELPVDDINGLRFNLSRCFSLAEIDVLSKTYPIEMRRTKAFTNEVAKRIKELKDLKDANNQGN